MCNKLEDETIGQFIIRSDCFGDRLIDVTEGRITQERPKSLKRSTVVQNAEYEEK